VVSFDGELSRVPAHKTRVDDIELPNIHPRKAFIIAALDKEIRLSFAQRIKGTLPEPYQPLISVEKEKDIPDFKFNDECKAFYRH
jgi:nuclear cap-binding protein subunit 1